MKMLPCLFAAVLASTALHARADEACNGFKWDASHEHALFLGPATKTTAGKDAASAPPLDADRLYAVALAPQEAVSLLSPPSKKMLNDGASAGLVRFKVASAGTYRVSLDTAFWIDLVVDGKTIPSIDFNGAHGCTTPRKIVVYDLPANRDITLQLGGQAAPEVRVALTPVPAAAK